ncbi:sensor histidine kinase [Agromyces allii]|uniref:Histidine kinase/HSP90-like ATPase domain-containing protein n=1 Tax=Agromyces allii TaxID=393607 RepID=A0ABN2QBX9_9MICO|nr:ATP-binding protein [Agromyces allii]
MALATVNAASDRTAETTSVEPSDSAVRLLAARDRLLGQLTLIAGAIGATGMAAAFLFAGSLNVFEKAALTAVSAVVLALIVVFTRTGLRLIGIAAAVASAAAVVIASAPGIDAANELGIAICASVTAPATSILLIPRRRGVPDMAVGLVAALGAVGYASVVVGGGNLYLMITATVGWAAAVTAGSWISVAMDRTVERFAVVDAAYDVEHAASVIATRKRQDARLLHDTVLATLSLVAHGGRGVDPETLRTQANIDSRMLRNLRLTGIADHDSTRFAAPPQEEFELGMTFESVRHRFAGLGLNVNWHGEGRLLLASDRIDALLGAVGECLENVRRHSGVIDADVTVTADDNAVRTMVTDQGAGFDPDAIEHGRLGFAESVVGRLESVGGKVRVFSSPGAGTTVMLEVPK